MRLHELLLLKLDFVLYHMVGAPIAAMLPARLAYLLAKVHGDFRHRLDTSLRREVASCLEGVLGSQLDAVGRELVVQDYFRLLSCETVDALRLIGSGRRLTSLVQVRGLEHLTAAIGRGKGVILCGAHFGSWRTSFRFLSLLGFPLTIVARTSRDKGGYRFRFRQPFYWLVWNRYFAHHLRREMLERGTENLGIAVRLARILDANELVCMDLDHTVGPTETANPVVVDFLGGRVRLLPGIVAVAQVTGAQVLVALIHRTSDWRHQVLEITPPISITADIVYSLRNCMVVLETAVRLRPAHWRYWNMEHLRKIGLHKERSGFGTFKG